MRDARSCSIPSALGGCLAELACNERALRAAVRAMAALRLADSSLHEAIERDADHDRAEVDRLEREARAELSALRADAERVVGGGCPGQAARIVQASMGALTRAVAEVKAAQVVALDSCTERAALEQGIAETLAKLAGIAPALAARAHAVMERAAVELGGTVLREAQLRASTVAAHVGGDVEGEIERTSVEVRLAAIARLGASATLSGAAAGGPALRWADSWVRSFARVRERCVAELAARDRSCRAGGASGDPRRGAGGAERARGRGRVVRRAARGAARDGDRRRDCGRAQAARRGARREAARPRGEPSRDRRNRGAARPAQPKRLGELARARF